MKKFVSIIVAVSLVMSLLLLQGCSKSNNGKESENTSTIESSGGKGEEINNQNNTGDEAVKSGEIKLPDICFNVKNPVLKFLTTAPKNEENEKTEAYFKEVTGQEIKVEYEVVPWANYQQKLAAYVASGSSPDMFSIDRVVSPYLVRKNLFEPAEKFFDMNDPLWKDTVEQARLVSYKGTQYGLALEPPRVVQCVYYNKKLIEEADLEDPRKVYERGEWDWNKFLEYVRELSTDLDGDGALDIYGLSMHDWASQFFVASTGEDIIKISSDGKIENNLRDPNFNRAYELLFELNKIGLDPAPWQFPKNFSKGKIAMVINHYWMFIGEPYNQMNKNGELSFVPLPKDPQADKHYGPAYITDWFIPKGAKNAEGTAAWYAFNRFNALKPNEKMKMEFDEMRKNKWGWDDEDIKYADEIMVKDIVPVSLIGDRMPGFPMQAQLWNEPFKRPWNQVLEEIYPSLQEAIDKLTSDSK